jgi:GGDEF domain-containing protein
MTKDDRLKRHRALEHYDVLGDGPQEEFEQTIDLVRALFATPIAAMTLFDGTEHCIKARRGLAVEELEGLDCFTLAFAADGALVVCDTQHDIRFGNRPDLAKPQPCRSVLGAPLCTPDGTRIGTLCAIDTVPRGFSEVDGEIMENLARITVSFLELRLLARRDAASGADSRRSFMDTLGRELERHKRTGRHSTLVRCHLDDSDDEMPEAERDKAIAAIADEIRQMMRKTDTLGRVAPSSLALLLVDVGSPDADAALARVRAISEAASLDGLGLRFGHAAASIDFGSAADWLAASDGSAGSKAAGRDTHPGPPTTHPGIGTRWKN